MKMIKPAMWREVLECAAVQLEEGPGWCKKADMDAQGRCCMMGAVRMVENLFVWSHEARTRIYDSLGGEARSWNDRSERTKTQVIEKLREIARS